MDVVMYDGVVQLHDSSLSRLLYWKGCCGDLLWRVWLGAGGAYLNFLHHKLVPSRDIRTGLGQTRAGALPDISQHLNYSHTSTSTQHSAFQASTPLDP